MDLIDSTLHKAALVGQKLCMYHIERYKHLQSLYSNKSLKKKILQEVTSGGSLYNALKPGSGEIRKSFKSAKALTSLVGDIVNTDQEENLVLV